MYGNFILHTEYICLRSLLGITFVQTSELLRSIIFVTSFNSFRFISIKKDVICKLEIIMWNDNRQNVMINCYACYDAMFKNNFFILRYFLLPISCFADIKSNQVNLSNILIFPTPKMLLLGRLVNSELWNKFWIYPYILVTQY